MGPVAEAGWFGVGGVALGGILAAFAGELQGRRDARRRERDGDREIAVRADERRQHRIERAYVAIQAHIDAWVGYADYFASFRFGIDPVPKLPDTPDEAAALASLAASDEVAAAMKEFAEARQRFFGSVVVFDQLRAAAPQTPKAIPAAVTEARTGAEGVIAAAEVVHQRLRREWVGTSS